MRALGGAIPLAWVALALACSVPRALAGLAFDHPAQELVYVTTTNVFSAMESDPGLKTEEKRLISLVETVITPHFDFDLMSRRVLGKHWREANEAQRQAFVGVFREFLIYTYAHALADYAGQKVSYLPSRLRQDQGQVMVRTAIDAGGTVPISIDYAMYANGDNAWKVYDVTIEGVSLVVTYRASFVNEIRANGIDTLIERLRAKVGNA